MKLRSLMQAAKNVPVSRVWEKAKEAHAICGKPTTTLFVDMLRCANKYGAGPTDYMMFEFWCLDDAERATYLTRVRSAAFVKRVNNRTDAAIFNDKNAFFEKFRPLMGREAINLFTCTEEEFAAFMADKDDVIVKPVDLDCGSGIEKLYKKDFADLHELWVYVKNPAKRLGIAEEVIRQHPQAAALHPDSINCIRVATFVQDGTPHVIYAACKAGTNGVAFDNMGRGGITMRFDLDTGRICGQGHDEELVKHDVHPTTGVVLKGYQMPFHEEVKALALKAAMMYPEFRYVGWDICMTENGPAIIEGNDYPGYDLAQIPDEGDPHPRQGLIPLFTKLGITV